MATTAFLNAPAVSMSRGRLAASISATMRWPASVTVCHIRRLPARTGVLPGRARPSTSAAMCIEFAVPMPAQTPGPVTAHELISASSSTVMWPVAT
jgi:hypothetical protein